LPFYFADYLDFSLICEYLASSKSLVHIKPLYYCFESGRAEVARTASVVCLLILGGCRSDSFLMSQLFWRQHLNCPRRQHCFVPPGLSPSKPGKASQSSNQIQAHSTGKKRCMGCGNACSGLLLVWTQVRG